MSVIERHNHQLMQRMNHIMHTTGSVDHRNLDWKPKRRYTHTRVLSVLGFVCFLSLNFAKKQEETDRLLRENRVYYIEPCMHAAVIYYTQDMLKRLQVSKPQYSVQSWVGR